MVESLEACGIHTRTEHQLKGTQQRVDVSYTHPLTGQRVHIDFTIVNPAAMSTAAAGAERYEADRLAESNERALRVFLSRNRLQNRNRPQNQLQPQSQLRQHRLPGQLCPAGLAHRRDRHGPHPAGLEIPG